uniref:BTB domain-containing protein n=1 Tax=Caenorhabditis tropicalis TaxID=1561998 RepID=A0A1I7TYL3_9PELO
MNSFCTDSARNLRIDMKNCLDVTGPTNHFESIAHFLRSDFSNNRELCDVFLQFETEKIKVHSVILASFSSTFSEKIKKQSEAKSSVLDLKFLKKESVQKVLDFIYFGKVSLGFGSLQDDLEAIAYFDIPQLQEEVEKKLIELAKQGKVVDVLNIVTTNMKTIPHSPSTLLSISDETVRDIVSILHEMSTTNRISFHEIKRLNTNTIIVIVSSRVPDTQKLDLINMSLKWIYERRLDDHKASSILGGLTFGSMTYNELVTLRNALIQTAIPVTVGRCVRLKWGENNTLDIVFNYAESSNHQESVRITCSSTSATKSTCSTASTGPSKLDTSQQSLTSESGYSKPYDCKFDDCNTAISFTAEDLKRLGFEKKNKK